MRACTVGIVGCVALLLLSPGFRVADPEPVTVSQDTEVSLMLKMQLRSGDTKEGTMVPYELRRSIRDNKNRVVVEAGTLAWGKVTSSSRRGLLGKPGKLEFTCEYLQLRGGTKIPLRYTKIGSKGRDNAANSVATAVLVTPVGFLINGRDVLIKKGERYTVYVDKDTTLGEADANAVRVQTPNPTNPDAKPTSGKSVFLTKDGKATVGTLVSFDGQKYVVATESGNVELAASDVESVRPAD